MRRCLQKDADACAELVDSHARMVGTVILRATSDRSLVEDLAQETFMRVFRGLPYFDARAKLSTWIYTIAHRVAMDHRRQPGSWRGEFVPGGVDFDSRPGRGADPEAAAARSELDRIVHHELEQLPDKYRLPLVYAALEELDYATIGAMLKVRPGTVKTLVFRGKLLLKERVDAVLDMKRQRERSNVG